MTKEQQQFLIDHAVSISVEFFRLKDQKIDEHPYGVIMTYGNFYVKSATPGERQFNFTTCLNGLIGMLNEWVHDGG